MNKLSKFAFKRGFIINEAYLRSFSRIFMGKELCYISLWIFGGLLCGT